MIPLKQTNIARRNILKGMLGGSAVTLGIPFLDCFLNTNGTAFANGTALPVAFGTWFWGLGLNPGRWEPKTAGKITEFGPELEPLNAFKEKVNVYSGTKVILDGRPMITHFTGEWAVLTGTTPREERVILPTVDMLISDVIGTKTRFRSIEVTSTGNPTHSYSRRPGAALNPAETSPSPLYPHFRAGVQGPERRGLHARPRRDGAPERAFGGQGPARRSDEDVGLFG